MKKFPLVILFILAGFANAFSQVNENEIFHLSGKISGHNKDGDIITLNYWGTDGKNAWDSVILKNGSFAFTGNVNRVSDAYLWTDSKNKNFGDPSVIRFLLEPSDITLFYTNEEVIINGSKTQQEKEQFDSVKTTLVVPRKHFQKEIDSLAKTADFKTNRESKKKIDELYGKIYAINQLIQPIDLNYIRHHPDSYLSGFLLSSYKRKLTLDTLQVYYSLLSEDVKKSTEAKKVIDYIYPLTNDTEFRNNNPVFGKEYNNKLKSLTSIYGITINDINGKPTSLAMFKGQYVLIDFWASWCPPCIQQIPSFKKLKDVYKADPIQFISVSLDTDHHKWKGAVKKYNASDMQFSDAMAFEGMLAVYCKVVTGVPRYVLIDKAGQVINYNTPQPDDPELKNILNKLLNKQD